MSRGTLYDLLSSGQLPSVHIGRARRVPIGELRRFVRERLAGPGDGRTRVEHCGLTTDTYEGVRRRAVGVMDLAVDPRSSELGVTEDRRRNAAVQISATTRLSARRS